jgi:hypothetical protein
VWEGRKINITFRSENLKGKGRLKDIGIDGRIISEWILEK